MVQTIDRAMKIVLLLTSDDNKPNWQISEISENIGLPISTTHRIISTLSKYELVSQVSDTKQYKIGPRWMEIGLRQLERMNLHTVARPIMEQLSQEVKESVYLSVPNENYSFAIERIDSPTKVRLVESMGERIPMHIGAPNKSMLASMEQGKAEAILTTLIMDKRKISDYLRNLAEIKQLGYSVSFGEKTAGTVSVAAPIIAFNRQVVAAISIGLLSQNFDKDREILLSEKVKQCAKEISARIGGS